MKIPEKVKVGGKTYEIKITDNLNLGNVNYSAEIDYLNLKIRIRQTALDKMKADLLHELMHAVYDHLGYVNHDEKEIDELANALHMVIADNPEIFKHEENETGVDAGQPPNRALIFSENGIALCADEIRSGDFDQAIQQLTAENARLKSELSDLQYMHDRLHDFETAAYEQDTEKIKKLKAEIERLTTENTQLEAQLKLLTDKPSDNGY